MCWQLVSIVSTGIYHSMADVQYTVGRTVDPVKASTDRLSFPGQRCNALLEQLGDHANRTTWLD